MASAADETSAVAVSLAVTEIPPFYTNTGPYSCTRASSTSLSGDTRSLNAVAASACMPGITTASKPGPIAHRCHHGFGFHCSEKLDGEGNALAPRTPECPHCAKDRAAGTGHAHVPRQNNDRGSEQHAPKIAFGGNEDRQEQRQRDNEVGAVP